MGAPQSQGPLKMGGGKKLAFSPPLAETARENTAPSGGSPRTNPAVFHGGQCAGTKAPSASPARGRARRPGPPPAPRGRCSAISLIFMGVNREAPSISVLCGQLVGLE